MGCTERVKTCMISNASKGVVRFGYAPFPWMSVRLILSSPGSMDGSAKHGFFSGSDRLCDGQNKTAEDSD